MIKLIDILEFVSKYSLDEKKYYRGKSLYTDDQYDIWLHLKQRKHYDERWTIVKKGETVNMDGDGIYLTTDQLLAIFANKQLDVGSFYKQAYSHMATLLMYAHLVHESAEKLSPGVVDRVIEKMKDFSEELKKVINKHRKPNLTVITEQEK